MKKGNRNWVKTVLQWGVLAAIVLTILICNWTSKPVDPEAYCPFGGLQALGSYINNNSLACSMSMVQIMMGVILAVGVVLFSKLFCGYLCPLGTVGEALGRLGRKMKVHRNIPFGSVADKMLRFVKYALLFLIVYMSVTSSELFCKNLDPFYAVATGFKGEITLWMVWITIPLLFLGSVFFSQFWCKYICPLGALSNIFKFTILFVAGIAVLWILGLIGVPGAWVWVLAAVCLASYIVEIVKMRSCVFPLMYVKRDQEKCIDCGICEKKCAYNIPAQKGPVKIKHVDCTLCGDCVTECPTDALGVNGKRKLYWLPGVIAVALFGLALWLGSSMELPTIDEKWGEWENVENLQSWEKEGLQSVKCYGSSRALSAKMQSVPGVYGVKTFVKRHAVVFSFDPAVTDTLKIQEALFTPMSRKFRTPPAEINELKVLRLGVEGLYDRMDVVNFGQLLQRVPGFYGYDATFACPVDVQVFVDPSLDITRQEMRDTIQVREFTVGERVIKVKFSLESFAVEEELVPVDDFMEQMFMPTQKLGRGYKSATEEYGDDAAFPKAVYELSYPEVEKPIVSRYIPYFGSHLSNFAGIMSMEFALKERVPVMRITYVESMWDDQKIWNDIFQAEKWTIHYANGDVIEEDAKLQFKNEGKTM